MATAPSQPFASGMSLHVEITVAPENVDKFLTELKTCFDKVVAEPKCLSFEVFTSPEQPGFFRFVENWDCTPQWFKENQMTKEYYKPYVEATEPMWTKPRELKIFQRMPTAGGWAVTKEGTFKQI